MNPLRILIVDDSKVSVETLKILLELRGHEVTPAHSAKDAQIIAKKLRFDVIILDYYMDVKVNGLEMLAWLRNEGITTPTMLASAIDEDRLRELKDKAIQFALGPALFVGKPQDASLLITEIESLAQGKGANV